MALKEAQVPKNLIPDPPAPAAGRSPRPKAISQLTRHDTWWIQPLITALVLGGFAVYATWRAFENEFFRSGPYLSPFYSPEIVTHWMVLGRHFSPALFILPFPLLFRATCYYYRKAYYRAFFWDPPACAVGEIAPRKNYTGERAFPFVLQNLHRYAFYFAVIILVILWWDALLAFDFGGKFGMGIGSLIFLGNVVLLSLYTFSCHSWRHLSGGCANCFSCSAGAKTQYTIWQRVTHLNENHALWAWLSLFGVVITDLYVRCLVTGVIQDVRFF
jgi:hypothetical protein